MAEHNGYWPFTGATALAPESSARTPSEPPRALGGQRLRLSQDNPMFGAGAGEGKAFSGRLANLKGSRMLQTPGSLALTCKEVRTMESITPGQRFGQITVVAPVTKCRWLCRCDCGQEREIKRTHLPRTKSCGCRPKQEPNTIRSIMGRLVITETGCAVWNGYRDKDGYGTVTYQARPHRVHRLLYEHFVGPVPEGLVLDHFTCDNRPCANFAHLKPVTPLENRLRGNDPAMLNARKTHCKNGHPLAGDNLAVYAGSRVCRTCSRENDRRRLAIKRRAEGRPLARHLRTHCIRGHPFSGDNLLLTPAGVRGCRECRREHDRKRTPRQKKKPPEESGG